MKTCGYISVLYVLHTLEKLAMESRPTLFIGLYSNGNTYHGGPYYIDFCMETVRFSGTPTMSNGEC